MSQNGDPDTGDGVRLRRRYPRVPATNAVLVNRLGPLPAEEFAVARDLGLGGCSFVTCEPYGVHAHLKVLITVRGKVVETRARVVYENRAMDGRYELGVEFVEIAGPDRDALAALLH